MGRSLQNSKPISLILMVNDAMSEPRESKVGTIRVGTRCEQADTWTVRISMNVLFDLPAVALSCIEC
jgi:hypothetical protein